MGGFTLVELIVVLLVLGILATLAVMSLMGWQDYADFKQNNEAAQSIFTAAQIQLTQYGERGQLSELKNEITNDGKEKSGYLLSEAGIADSDVWQPDAAGRISQTSQIYYLKAEKGDYQIYQKYLKGKTTAELKVLAESGTLGHGNSLVQCRRLKALFDMLDPYIADKSILDAAVCIEFDPNPKVAQVYSAFYNPKLTGFTYESSAAGNMFAPINKENRSTEKRRARQVGYYGVKMLSVGTDNDLRRPIINNVRLNNEETLNLSWTVSLKQDKNMEALEGLFYKLDIYRVGTEDKETRLGTITLGTADAGLNIQNAGNGFYYVNAQYDIVEYTDAGKIEHWKTVTDGTEEKNSVMSFPIRINKTEGTIELILDAVDVSTDESADTKAVFNSASIERLGLDADEICIYVSGMRPGVYETTKTKQSNSEHQYFSSFQKNDTDAEESRIFTIVNTRQFNNIRYYEKKHPVTEGKETNIQYRLLADLDWNVTVNSGVVYNSAVNPVVPENLETMTEGEKSDINFVPILSLGKNSTLMTTESNSVHALKNFQLYLTNVPTVIGGDEVPKNTVGLFVLNKGIIKNLTLEEVLVRGTEAGSDETSGDSQTGAGNAYETGAAGGFCGVNQGTLTNLTVQSGTVSGNTHVGGILGAVDTRSGKGTADEGIFLTELLNRASVTGNLCVGGIAGSLKTETQSIIVKNCSNYGAVFGEDRENSDDAKDSYYIGGIAGYVELTGTADTDLTELKIDSCTSSPAFEKDWVDAILKDMQDSIENNREPEKLSGIYVGGIVGLNKGCVIENCDTLQESAMEKGYIIGKKYVGGIAGFNEGTTGIIGGEKGRNQAQIIGQEFVGGIVGCNAKGVWEEGNREVRILTRAEANALDGKDADAPEDIVISNWVNEGAIIAAGSYAGGITGYNLGQIRGCNSDVDYSDEVKNAAQVTVNSQYAGGIAGYNAGLIDGWLTDSSSEVLSAVSVISGKNFVGGIAGYNDAGGVIRHYELRGGYIKGRKFVGGFIGVNADASVFETRIYSNPNEVAGDYFVGGIIGANLVPTDKDITAYFKADNFLGSLHADKGAFAGGFIGYNFLLTADTEASVIRQAVNDLCGKFPEISETDNISDISREFQSIEQPLKDLLEGNRNQGNKLVITGETLDEETLDTQTRLGKISALVYVGGVIGYNQASTILEIKNVENISLVEASAYIEREESGIVWDSDDSVKVGPDLEGKTKRYSYAGGIIGRVAPNVTLENCRNRDVGEVRSQGTYTGGLAELNEGRILNCTAGSLGDGTQDYIGGLAGVNFGSVENCSVSGTIMGQSRIGGLVSENYGQIINPSVGEDGNGCYIETTGQDAGGVAGYGFPGSSVIWDNGAVIDINMDGSGRRVGGVIGTNEGTVTVTMAESNKGKVIENKENNSIIGHSYVGGFIGVQKGSADLGYMHNYAEVQAEQGFAGGIAAWISNTDTDADENAADSVIHNCVNFGAVSVLTENDDDEIDLFPGDIIVDEDDRSKKAKDKDLLNSAAGGITAVNFGTIMECVDHGIVDGGNGFSGGIAGLNFGKISYSKVSGERDRLALSGDQFIGGITAKNKADAVIEHCAVLKLELQNQSFTAEGYMGGVAGENLGKIANCSVGVDWDPENRTDAKYEYADWHQAASEAVMRAVGRVKSETDSSYSLEDDDNAVVLISNAADVSMGGVAGVNRYPEETGSSDENGTITGIKEDKGGDSAYTVVLADLKFTEHSMSYYGNIGGVAGINQGVIRNYEFNGFVHGSANDPSHAPEYSPNYDYEQTGSTIFGYGGIAGVNGDDEAADDAEIRDCLINMVRVNGIGSATNRANVGGVAGVNGMDAKISHIMYGDRDELAEILETSDRKFFFTELNDTKYKGTVWVGTDNDTGVGHVGGVAGYNQGWIAYINDWKKYEQNRDQYFTEDGYVNVDAPDKESDFKKAGTDYTAVIVYSTGHTGGIAGFNRRTGQIRNAVTGRRWAVGATKQEQDNGTGGIIGYNISEQNLEYCDNHASVVKLTGNSVGGIIGRNETATSSSWRIYNCRNYGEIVAEARGGGILGQMKYKGGTLEECENYGIITANREACGGVIAILYGLNLAETVNLTNCRNFGDIGSSSKDIPTGGIVGQINAANDVGRTANFYNCVNTGLIGGSDTNNSAGILAMARKMNANFYHCRNYGYSKNGENKAFGGIYCSGDNIKMTDCFGVTDRNAAGYPITSGVGSAVFGGYYFTDTAASDQQFFYIRKIKAVAEGKNLGNEDYLGYVISKGTTNNNTYFKSPTADKPGFYSLEFNKPVDLKTITLSWNRDADTNFRFYSYTLVFYDKFNNELKTIEVDEQRSAEYDGIFRFDESESGLQNVFRVDIRDITTVTKKGNKTEAANAALVKVSANAVLEGGTEGVDCLVYEYGKGSKRKTAEYSAEYELGAELPSPSAPDQLKDDARYGIPLYVSNLGNHYEASSLSAQIRVENLGDHSLEALLLRNYLTERTENSLLAYRLYKSVDKDLVVSNGIVELKQPKIGEKKPMGGYYRIPWKGDPQSQYYYAEYVYYAENKDGAIKELGETDDTGAVRWNKYTSYTNGIDILTDYTYGGIRADGVLIRVQAGAQTAAGSEICSEWSGDAKISFGITLPAPLVHWELVTLKDESCYRVVLDNKSDYEALKKDHPELDLNEVKINTWLMKGEGKVKNTEMEFTAKEGALLNKDGDYRLLAGSDKENRYLVAYASTDMAGFDRSTESIREAQLPSKDQYADGNAQEALMANAVLEASDKTGFFGDTMTSLSYQTTLEVVDSWVINYRTELVAVKNKLGIPVAYAVSPFTRTSPNGTKTSKITLNNLPNDFLDRESSDAKAGYIYDKVRIRMYPTKMSNDIFYQGWQMKLPGGHATMSLEELSKLHVTEDGQLGKDTDPVLVAETNGKKTLQPGYVIEYAGNDGYTLYYNTLLREMVTASDDGEKINEDWLYKYNKQQKTYRYHQVFYHPVDLKTELSGKGIQPEPIAYVNAKTAVNDDGTVIWQDGDYQTTNEFTLTWDHKYVDDSSPAYGTAENQYKRDAKYLLSVDGISRQVSATGTTEQSTPIATNVSIVTEDKPEYNTWSAHSANWSYDAIRVTLTRLGEIGSGGITNKFPAVFTKEYPLKKRLATVGKPSIANKTIGGEIQKDGMEYVISWTGIDKMNLSSQEKENQRTAFQNYEVVVTGLTSGTIYTGYTAEHDITADSLELDFAAPVAADTGDKYFCQGEKISITVTAIAREDKDSVQYTYRNGVTSASLETDIPIRLEAPDMGRDGDPDTNMTATVKTPVSVEDFEKGCITLHMKRETGVKYQIALQIFETRGDAESAGNPIGEIQGLPAKDDENRVYMNEQADDCTYTVTGIPAKYAGKWLRVILRAVSDNSISSLWTEDDTDMEYFDGTVIKNHNKVEPYRLFQLPAVQVNPVKVGESVGVETIEYDLLNNGVPDGSYKAAAAQNVITFTTVDYADDYQLNIIQTPQAAERTATPANADMVASDLILMNMKLNEDENGYTIGYQSSELPDRILDDGDDGTAEIQEISLQIDGDAVILPYKKMIPIIETDDGSFTLEVEASLKAERDEKTGLIMFTLILPDTEKIEETSGEEIALPDNANLDFTEQILIQSLAGENHADDPLREQPYCDSDWAAVSRIDDSLTVIPDAFPMSNMAEDGSDEPAGKAGIDGALVKESEHAGFAYELEKAFKGTTRYVVRVTDESDNLLGIYSVPYDQQLSKSQYVANVWLPVELASDIKQTIKLNFASIFSLRKGKDGKYSGGLSRFSDKTYELVLPPVTQITAASLSQYISEPLVCETTVSGRTRNVRIRKVTAKQRQIEWDYRYDNTRTVGYELAVQGENMASDYTLELDLTRNEFGRFAGLEEYMTAEGKILYSVAYNLEGDIIPFTSGTLSATPSDADPQTATASNATPGNASESGIPPLATSSVMDQPGVLILNCSLRVEQQKDRLKFILTLPDAAIGQLKGNGVEQYQSSEYYYDGGLYHTEQISVYPIAVNPYYELPEQEWVAILRSYRDGEENAASEENSEDGDLRNNLK